MSMALTPLSIPTPIGPVAGFARPHTIEGQYLKYYGELKVFQAVSAFFFNDGHEIASLPKEIWVKPVNNTAYLYYIDDTLKFQNDALARQVHAWIKEFKETNQCLVTLGEINSIGWKLKNFIYAKVGFTSTPIPETFSQEDIVTMGMSKSDLNAFIMLQPEFRLPMLSCHDFTLLKSKEKGFCEMLYYGGANKEFKLFEFLKNWGYKTVESPQAGDLILYLQDGRPVHTGSYLGNNIVESKLGNKSQLCHQHALSALPVESGNQMVFYRKVKKVKYKTFNQILMENAHFHFQKLNPTEVKSALAAAMGPRQ
jgi:hypothetical protein